MRILGIETSCDETGIAIYDSEEGLLAHMLHSQNKIHLPYGGIVPELASRDHIQKILPLLKTTLQKAQIDKNSLDAIAYTAGPGLAGALLVGAMTAASLAFALKIPTIKVHHMEAHLLAPFLEKDMPQFPFLALLVSGGHTLLIKAQEIGHYKILGESVDDAAGEAFDKVAKILGLSYPGGPVLSELAKKGDKNRFRFPRPMTDKPGLNFSFSGLKTHAFNTLRKHNDSPKIKADIARAFQEAMSDTFYIKCRRAIEKTGLKRLVVAGGVSANWHLREKLANLAEIKSIKIYYPRLEFCTDNGAMIAYAGYRRLLLTGSNSNFKIEIFPRWKM